MKNKIIVCLSGSFLAVLFTTANAQVSSASVRPVKNIPAQTECVSENAIVPAACNEPGPELLRNFEQKFENITGVRWYESSFGFVFKLNLKGIDYRVDFDKNGNWLSTIRNYDKMKLPMDVRHLINESYNDYSITLVQEIETPGNRLTFLVHLDGKKDMIQVSVSGDEVQEYQRFGKIRSR
jgi:hypothetical protein